MRKYKVSIQNINNSSEWIINILLSTGSFTEDDTYNCAMSWNGSLSSLAGILQAALNSLEKGSWKIDLEKGSSVYQPRQESSHE